MNKNFVKKLTILSLITSGFVSASCGKDVNSTGNSANAYYDPQQASSSNPANDPSDLSRRSVDGVRPKVVIKNMFYRVNKELGAVVDDLFGELVSRNPNNPVNFDDVTSFNVAIHQAKLSLDSTNMDNLMKDYVLNYPDSPLSEMKQTIEAGGRMTIKGKMKQIGLRLPFEMSGMIHATPDGLMELVPDSIKTAGIPSKGLLDLFGVATQSLINVNEQRGMKISGNSIILSPGKMFPPPLMQGKVSRVETEANKLIIYFDDGVRLERPPLPINDPTIKNYQHVYGGAVRLVGNETHENTNLLMIDMDQSNLFDFSISEYMNHIMAGQVNVLNRAGTLLNFMPDYNDIPKRLNRKPIFKSVGDNVGEIYQTNPQSNPALTKQKNWSNQPTPFPVRN
ncbi:MAG: hypothetical protein H7263_06225 [Candidatus Sericytochromatia bacterium]|nr:hypothetical protein [Candidatus Sericytochromatia bacterium]